MKWCTENAQLWKCLTVSIFLRSTKWSFQIPRIPGNAWRIQTDTFALAQVYCNIHKLFLGVAPQKQLHYALSLKVFETVGMLTAHPTPASFTQALHSFYDVGGFRFFYRSLYPFARRSLNAPRTRPFCSRAAASIFGSFLRQLLHRFYDIPPPYLSLSLSAFSSPLSFTSLLISLLSPLPHRFRSRHLVPPSRVLPSFHVICFPFIVVFLTRTWCTLQWSFQYTLHSPLTYLPASSCKYLFTLFVWNTLPFHCAPTSPFTTHGNYPAFKRCFFYFCREKHLSVNYILFAHVVINFTRDLGPINSLLSLPL